MLSVQGEGDLWLVHQTRVVGPLANSLSNENKLCKLISLESTCDYISKPQNWVFSGAFEK